MRNTFKELESKKRKVWEAIFVDQLSRAETAKKLEVSTSTINKWINKYKWNRHSEKALHDLPEITSYQRPTLDGYPMDRKKAEAKNLILLKGFLQKEVAAIVGVSEKTISAWSKQYGWKKFKSKEIDAAGGLSELMDGFFKHILLHNSDIYDKLKKRWFEYLQAYEKQIKK